MTKWQIARVRAHQETFVDCHVVLINLVDTININSRMTNMASS